MRFILFSFLFWRFVLFIPLLVAQFILPYRVGYEYTNIVQFGGAFFPVSHFLLYPWSNFDGLHYLYIAEYGYNNNFGFFPFYPLIIHFFSFLFETGKPFGAIQFFSGFLIANISFLGALLVFKKLLTNDYPKQTIHDSIVFLLLFPVSFFFGSMYSESLFLLCTLIAFYFARRKQWFLAGVFASFASLTRIVGIFLFPVLLYEYFVEQKKRTFRSVFSLFLPVVSLAGYAYFNFIKTGDFLYFIHAQGNFGNNRTVNSIVLFPQTIVRYIKILFTVKPIQYEWWISLLELGTFFFCLLLLYYAWKKKVRTSYLIFSVLSFLLPISTGTFTALPRYSIILFPVFLSLALIENKWVKIVYMVISPIIAFLLLIYFSKGYFIS